jgi:Fe-S-cluster formation regulator IscX/YfhJ
VVEIIIIFKDIELISEVLEDSQETLDPIEIFFETDKSVMILVDFLEDFVEDVLFEAGQRGEIE